MPHYVAFHQSLHCLLRQNQSSEKIFFFFFEIITCDPSIYTMVHPDLTVSNSGFPQALEIMENLEIHKKVPCIEKSWNLKKTE